MPEKFVTHVVQVRRGLMRTNWPFDSLGLLHTPVSDLAWSAAKAFLQLQGQFPERENPAPIDPKGRMNMVLRVPGRDDALRPELSLHSQLKGQWSDMDVDELGEEGVIELYSRCSFVVLELVDSLEV